MTARTFLIVWGLPILAGFLCDVKAGPVFNSISPLHGTPGTVVVLQGTGFDAGAMYDVRIGEKLAPVITRDSGQLQFSVPPGAISGAVQVIGAGQTNSLPLRFTVTRRIPGVFRPPGGVVSAGYEAFTHGGFSPIQEANGGFVAEVPVDAAQLIWVFGSDSQPAYLAMITPSMSEVTIDSQSTALALPFLVPGVATTDADRAMAILQRVRQRPESSRLTELITAVSPGNADYLDDTRIEDAWTALVQELHSPVAPVRNGISRHTLRPQDLFLFHGLTPDFAATIPSTPVSLTATLEPIPDSVLDDVRFKLKPESHSNIDWFVELYRLDPSQFAGGRAGIERLKSSDTPIRLPDGPIQIGLVRSKLESKNFNLPGLIADQVSGLLFGPLQDEFGQNSFKLRSSTPGVYVSQAYSGNLWYGTRVVLPNTAGGIFGRHQSDEISRLGASWDWGQAFAANLTVAIVDVVSILVPADAIVDKPEAWHKMVRTVFIDVVKAAQTYYLQAQVDMDVVWDFVTTVSKSIFKGVIDLGIESLGKDGSVVEKLGRFGKVGGKFIAKSINIFKKVSSGLQVAERMSGLLLPNSLALERSVMVVGDPFVPAIEEFSPRRGRGGDLVYIRGRNFPSAISNITVSFCQFGSTADPTSVTTSLKSTVVGLTPDSMTIEVPTNGWATFPNGRAFLCVETSTGRSSTTGLPELIREYFFEEPPRLKAIVNGPVPAGGLLHITGSGFTPRGKTAELVDLEGPGSGFGSIIHATATNLVVQLSPGLEDGNWNLRLRAGPEALGDPIHFRVLTPSAPPPRGFEGLDITVTQLDMSNARDGVISLGEAFHIANGTLGRPIEVHLPCEFLPPDDPSACPFKPREIDWVKGADNETGAGGGPASRDVITTKASTTPIPGGRLPPPTNGDRYVLPIVIDGSDADPGRAGWLLDGVSGVTLQGATLRNFPGHGIHLRGGAVGNVLESVTVDKPGRVGVYLEGNAQANRFNSLLVMGAGLHGVVFSGPEVKYNRVEGPRDFGAQPKIGVMGSGGWGVVFENAAQMNTVHTGPVSENAFGGVRVIGSKTQYNLFGRPTRLTLIREEVHSNGGPGVYLGPGVQHTVLSYLSVRGNRGDGIVLEGPDCAFNHLDGIMTSFRDPGNGQPAVAHPNEGSGIRLIQGAHDNLLGTLDPGLNFPFNLYGPDRDYNISLEGDGTSHNLITAGYFGSSSALDIPVQLPAGLGGVALLNGARNNVVGHEHGDLANRFSAWNGPGILLDDSAANTIYGNYMTGVNILPGVVGISIQNGSRDNQIGKPGAKQRIDRGFDLLFIQFGNTIGICSKAGIAIEGAGGTVGLDGELVGPNRLRNNELRNNATGLLLGPQAWANVIGGPGPTDGNKIFGSRIAEIRFEKNPLPDRAWRNRFERNKLGGPPSIGGAPELPFLPAPKPLDHLMGLVPKIGLLIDPASTNQVFGEGLTLANSFELDLVGAYIEGGSGVRLQGNIFDRNVIAGLVVHGGHSHEIGGLQKDSANRFIGNGRSQEAQGGLIFSGGGGHTLRYATVGGIANLANRGFGLLMLDSSKNTIGSPREVAGNEFIFNQSHGVWIQGPGSTKNQFGNNFIGIDRKRRPAGNLGDGVRMDSGASHNRIGGGLEFAQSHFQYVVPADNVIAHNAGDGVRIIGADTIGNSILDNRITANVGLGIRLVGGNFDHSPPRYLSYDDFTLSGVALDLAMTPAGSLIQAFSDPDPTAPEGDQYLGQDVVRPGGGFFIRLLRAPTGQVTLTATHAIHRSTSPFGSGTVVPIAFRIQRSGTGLPETVSPGTPQVSVLRLSLSAIHSDVRVQSLKVRARGTLAPHPGLSSIRIYRDTDRNGMVSEGDVALSAPGEFSVEGVASLTLNNALVSAGIDDRWLVAVAVASNTGLGQEFHLEIDEPEAVAALFSPGQTSARALGPFPIRSGVFAIGPSTARQTYNAWLQVHFTPAQLNDPKIIAEGADPDGEGIINLSEYAFGLDPLRADTEPSSSRMTAKLPGIVAPDSTRPLELSYARRPDPVDLNYFLEHSTRFDAWKPMDSNKLHLLGSSSEPGLPGFVRVRYRIELPTIPFGVEEFFRLRVIRNP